MERFIDSERESKKRGSYRLHNQTGCILCNNSAIGDRCSYVIANEFSKVQMDLPEELAEAWVQSS